MRKVVGRVINGKYVTDPTEMRAELVKKYDFSGAASTKFHAPAIVTDSTFMKGWYSGDQFESCPEVGEFYRQRAIEAGVSPVGKRYLHQLAEYPGDPRAWVDGRGDVKRVCEERGYICDGMVKVNNEKHEYVDPGTYVADDIVEDYVRDQIEAQPDFVPSVSEIMEMKEAAREKLTPKYDHAEPVE